MPARNKDGLEIIKREKRNLYLLVAVKAFQQKGFHGTTVKDITDAAGTSVGNFYQRSKRPHCGDRMHQPFSPDVLLVGEDRFQEGC